MRSLHSYFRFSPIVLTLLSAGIATAQATESDRASNAIAPTKTSAATLKNLRSNTALILQPDIIYYDAIEEGQIVDGGVITVDQTNPLQSFRASQAVIPAPAYSSETIVSNGNTANRIDIVLVGDGYIQEELATYANDANNLVNGFFNEGVLNNYRRYFNVHRVDVISNESGVDNDPQGTLKDTALDMQYYCSNIARLLCVNVSKAREAASNAPETDQILALANSTTYGGAGYPSSDLGTVAGKNGSALEVAIHEFGHSFADLADEYTYGGSETYTGPELSPVNVSIYQQTDMEQQQTKWYRWFSEPGIGTFEGGNYSVYGVYRPTNNSKMRSLGQPFGPINDEQLIIKIYQTVNPIDSATPEGIVNQGTLLTVNPVQPENYDLTIQWWVNSALVQNGGNTFNTAILPAGNNTVAVRVIDETDQVRNETARQQWLTAERIWTVIDNGSSTADLDLSFKRTTFMGWAEPFQFWKKGETGFIYFSATINNNGGDTAENVQLTLPIPEGVDWLGFESTSAGCFANQASVTCDIDAINSGSNADIMFSFATNDKNRKSYTGTISSDAIDPDQSNNTTSQNFGGSLGWISLFGLLGLAIRKKL